MKLITILVFAVTSLFNSFAAKAQQLHVFFGNLHSHTSYSDGRGTPEEAYQHARDVANLDFLAITEHNHPQAGRIHREPELYNGPLSISLISAARRFTENGRFVAIYGQEFSSISRGNHGNVFEVNTVINTGDVPNGAWDALLNNWIPNHLDSQGQRALILLNHPRSSSSPNSIEYGRDDFNTLEAWRTALDRDAQLINIVNGPSHDRPLPGRPSESEFLRYLNLGLHVAPTADQDNHRRNWGSAADTRTGVITTTLTKANILSALRARHVYASQDRNLRIIARINGELMGTILQGNQVPDVNSNLNIEVQLVDDDEPMADYRIDVYSDVVGGNDRADVVQQLPFSGNDTVTITNVRYIGPGQYVFLKITQFDDHEGRNDHAWLAPVWFEPNGQTPGPQVEAVDLHVDLVAEIATVTNRGTQELNLNGWVLVSVQGNQRFTFRDVSLLLGASVRVTSGPDARDNPPTDLLWTTSRRWRNSGDPGQLLDAQGNIRAETQ